MAKVIACRRAAQNGDDLVTWTEINVIAATLFESSWQWWLYAAFAFLYGLVVMVTVIVLLIKSAEASIKPEDEKKQIES